MTIAALVTVSSTISLGRWQLSRAAQKEALQAEIEAQKLKPPLEQADFLALERPAEMLHRPVHLRGLWLAAQSVYLDNRQMHGVPGFYVLTPLALEGSNQTVMVQRGWIQRNFNDRTQLGAVETPAGLVDVTGLIEPPPGHLLELGKPAAPASAPAGEGLRPSGRISTSKASVPKRNCRCAPTCRCSRPGPLPRACSAIGRRPRWAWRNTMAMHSSGSACRPSW